MTKIAIQGIGGRMGQALCRLIEARSDCQVVAGVDLRANPAAQPPVYESLEAMSQQPDVLIDFSSPAATAKAVGWCAEHKVPCVICTTGLDEATERALVQLSQHVAVFKSANLSMGINLLIELARTAVQMLGEDYDIEIIEKHHHNKVDAPSGTALMIADEINDAANGAYHYVYDRHAVRQPRDKHEIGLHAVRGGSIVGEHEVLLCGPDEVISLGHSAASREVFANGAVNAAVFLAGKGPGLYSMKDMMRHE